MRHFRHFALSPLLLCFLLLACAKDNPLTPRPPVIPAAPTNLTAQADSSSQISLGWLDRSNNEDGFRIERRTGAGGAWSQIAQTVAGVISYQNTGLTYNTTYYYRVLAFNVAGNSAYSSEASATTPQVPPVAPSNLIAATASASQINITWNDESDNEDGFKIERKTGAGGYSEIAQTAAGVISYQNTGLTSNTTYYYRVLAFNVAGNSAYSNEASATTPQVPPVAPSNLIAATASASQINITWNDESDNEDGFKIERKIGAGGYSEIAQTAAGVAAYQNVGLSASTEYWYRVLAFNVAGNSAYSNEASATTDSGEVVILNEGFEGNWPRTGWEVSGNPTWDDESLNHYSGTWAAWCAGGGASGRDPSVSPCPNDMNAWMTYGPFDLSDAGSAVFSFWEAYRTEAGYDFCFYGLSTNGVNFDGYQRSGEAFSWLRVQRDFSNFGNVNYLGARQVWIGFQFRSDASNTSVGWWVDDVSITKRTGGRAIPPSAGQESAGEVILQVFSPSGAYEEQDLPRMSENKDRPQGDPQAIPLPHLKEEK